MTTDIIDDLKNMIRRDFAVIYRKYHEALPYSYTQYVKRNPSKRMTGNFGFLANFHGKLLQKNFEYILNEATLLVSDYVHTYKVQPFGGICEYKQIYFAGRAIEKAILQPANYPDEKVGGTLDHADLAKIHMYTMVGLMDYILSRDGCGHQRPRISRALIELIDQDLFNAHLGKYGGYLLFKCQGDEPHPNDATIIAAS